MAMTIAERNELDALRADVEKLKTIVAAIDARKKPGPKPKAK